MAKFCTNCGNALKDGAAFCDNCGSPGNATAPAEDTSLVGFSKRVNDPEILAAIKKTRKASKISLFFIVPLPLIGFFIYSLVNDSMETSDGLLYGAVVSCVFLIFALVSFIKQRPSNAYDATVIKKKQTLRERGEKDAVDEYITIVRTDDGKKKKIREYGGRTFAYSYLNEGDRFRYHPQFAFPYELYDKRNANGIYCVACQTNNPTSRDRCEKCGIPLLK